MHRFKIPHIISLFIKMCYKEAKIANGRMFGGQNTIGRLEIWF